LKAATVLRGIGLAKIGFCGTVKGPFLDNIFMKVINLYGAPSAGKSTAMLGLTYHLKLMGLSAENTPEFFKEMIYENSSAETFGGQLYVLGEQNRRLARLKGKNDFTITDCPLPLIGYYTSQNYVGGFNEFLNNLYHTYDNVNYFIVRKHEFESEKRAHSQEQADTIEQALPAYLKQMGVECVVMESGEDLVERIIADMIERNVIAVEHLANARHAETRLLAQKRGVK